MPSAPRPRRARHDEGRESGQEEGRTCARAELSRADHEENREQDNVRVVGQRVQGERYVKRDWRARGDRWNPTGAGKYRRPTTTNAA